MCIVLVVVSHVCNAYRADYGIKMPFTDFFSAFRMPLYFFLSGLFFKEYNGLRDFAMRKTNKLLVPFFFFYFTTCVALVFVLKPLGIILDGVQGRYVLWGFVNQRMFANGPLWFLLCLFWVNIYFYGILLLTKRFGRSECQTARLLILGALFCGMTGTRLGHRLWMFADTALTCMPFFCVGYVFRKHTNILYPAKWDKYLLVLFVIMAVLAYMFRGGMEFFMNDMQDHSPVNLYLGGVSGTLAVLFLAKRFGRIPVISYWGRYSIIILCTHFIIAQMLCLAFRNTGLTETIGVWPSVALCFVATMLICTGLIPVCIRYIPQFTAQKDFFKITTK